MKYKKIVLATRNPGKLIELKQLLEVGGVEFIPVAEFGLEDIEETGETFRENAILKARYVAQQTDLPAIADDSGLSINAFNFYPGIFSARCAGENATDEEKRQHILDKMKGIENRDAHFTCCMALVDPNDLDYSVVFTGVCHGTILEEARGEAKPQLQYDSLFNYVGMTFAEMSEEQKNIVSHRGRSAEQMRDYLQNVFTKVCGGCKWFDRDDYMSDKGSCCYGVPNIKFDKKACIEYAEDREKINYKKIVKYDGYVIRVPGYSCENCDCSSTYVEHFFWHNPDDYVNPEVDSREYIANQANCSRLVCPSCGSWWRVGERYGR